MAVKTTGASVASWLRSIGQVVLAFACNGRPAARSRWSLARGVLPASLGVLLAALAIATPAEAAGSWVADAMSPTLRQGEYRYAGDVLAPHPGTPTAGDSITVVSWQLGYRSHHPGLAVALCAAGRCVDATAGRGRSRLFAGLAPDTPFRFYFQVAGGGMLSPTVASVPVQVVVNFQ